MARNRRKKRFPLMLEAPLQNHVNAPQTEKEKPIRLKEVLSKAVPSAPHVTTNITKKG